MRFGSCTYSRNHFYIGLCLPDETYFCAFISFASLNEKYFNFQRLLQNVLSFLRSYKIHGAKNQLWRFLKSSIFRILVQRYCCIPSAALNTGGSCDDLYCPVCRSHVHLQVSCISKLPKFMLLARCI